MGQLFGIENQFVARREQAQIASRVLVEGTAKGIERSDGDVVLDVGIDLPVQAYFLMRHSPIRRGKSLKGSIPAPKKHGPRAARDNGRHGCR
jgi:hypothetical protein